MQWIKCTEQMPGEKDFVLGFSRDGEMEVTWFSGHMWSYAGTFVDEDYFTHWMTLPEPPAT